MQQQSENLQQSDIYGFTFYGSTSSVLPTEVIITHSSTVDDPQTSLWTNISGTILLVEKGYNENFKDNFSILSAPENKIAFTSIVLGWQQKISDTDILKHQ